MKNISLIGFLCALGAAITSCGLRAPPDETLVLHTRAQNVYREGHYAKAVEMLADEKNFAPSLVLRGKAEYLSGDLGTAEKSLKRALAKKPQNAEALFFLARVFREKGETEAARKTAEKILADNPLDIRALRFAAELARENGAAGEAASAVFLDRAVEASAESALVFLDRARLRWVGGNSGGALEDLECARVLLSEDSSVMKSVEKLASVIREVSR